MVRLAFYRGKGNKSSSSPDSIPPWIRFIIRRRTMGKYSHVELVFGDQPLSGLAFSASGSSNPPGVHLEQKDLSKDWDFVTLPIKDDGCQQMAIEYLKCYKGQPFGLRGLVSFLIPWIQIRTKEWYCSEIIILVLQQCFGMFKEATLAMSPNHMFRYLEKQHYETLPVSEYFTHPVWPPCGP